MATAPVEILPSDSWVLVDSSPSTIAETVRDCLTASVKTLPPWLFYDKEGSSLFDRITQLPEYYLTRVERSIFAADAAEMMALAACGDRLRVIEMGAGSADKTRILLATAAEMQGRVSYHPVDVSESALEEARLRIESELPDVHCEPLVADFTRELRLGRGRDGERQVVLFIGSSIGNFLPAEAVSLLRRLRDALTRGDSILLGVDLAPTAEGKSRKELIAAYDDAEGVTAQFNKNVLARLNRELDAEFDLDAFAHRIRWNEDESRIEMHLESRVDQRVRIGALGMEVEFAAGETIHTENSYKYRIGEAERMLTAAGFGHPQRWRDDEGWFAVYLAEVE